MTPELRAVGDACEAVLGFFYPDTPPKAAALEPVGSRFTAAASKVVVLGVEGAWRGNLVLMFPAARLAELAGRFMGMDLGLEWAEAIDDVLLELGNQIAARACRELEEAGLGRTDLTPPSLICAGGEISMAWNLREGPVLRLEDHLDIAVGIAPGPPRRATADADGG